MLIYLDGAGPAEQRTWLYAPVTVANTVIGFQPGLKELVNIEVGILYWLYVYSAKNIFFFRKIYI